MNFGVLPVHFILLTLLQGQEELRDPFPIITFVSLQISNLQSLLNLNPLNLKWKWIVHQTQRNLNG